MSVRRHILSVLACLIIALLFMPSAYVSSQVVHWPNDVGAQTAREAMQSVETNMLPLPDGASTGLRSLRGSTPSILSRSDNKGVPAGLSLIALASQYNWTAESDQASARLGYSVGTAGDVNGDDYTDVIVGAYQYDNGQTDEGRVYLYYGSATGLSASPNWAAESDQISAYFGYSVGTAGDVNGDGYDDVVIGAPGYGGSFYKGRVYVYFGSATGLSASPNWTVDGDQIWAEFGSSVGTAGDVNSDSYDDIIVGAYKYDNGEFDEGRAYVYYGSASGPSTTPNWTAESNQAGAYFGCSMGTAGDVNRDGYDDVIVGAYGYSNGQTGEGRAYIYYGSGGGLSASPNWTAESDQTSAYFGCSVGTAGDVNSDGYDDIVVGARQYDNGQSDEGRAYVYYGSAIGVSGTPNWTVESNQAGAYFGRSVGKAGDVNSDGYSDIIIGADYYDNGQYDEGRSYVYHGSSDGLSASPNWTADSDQNFAYFGYSVSTAGDVNADSYDDIIIGAYSYDNGQTDEGRAYAYYGSATGLPLTPPIYVPDDYPTITTALAVSSPGDIIIVRNGTYTEDVRIGVNNLTIISENGSAVTTVQPSSTGGDVFTVEADYVTISGFAVIGASGLGSAGIHIWPGTNYCTITDNNIMSNYYGIYAWSNNYGITIRDNQISSNYSKGISLAEPGNNIVTGNTMSFNGIQLWGSSNNTITNNTISGTNPGIEILFSSTGNTISGNIISSCIQWGIKISDGGNNTITGNNISNSGNAIDVSGIGGNTISNNSLFSNGYSGITLYVGNNTVSGNTISNNVSGIRIWSGNNIVTGNSVSGNNTGISVSYGQNQITHNTVLNSSGRGISIGGSVKADFDNLIDTTNNINGKPVYYYFDQTDIVIDGLETTHLTLAYCSNLTVRKSIVSGGDGIILCYSNNNIINGCNISHNYMGVSLSQSNNNSISHNDISFNKEQGIYLYGSDGNQITGNTVSHNSDGISLFSDGWVNSNDNNIIANNLIFSNDGIGVYLRYSDSNTITGNTVLSSTEWGIYLFWGCDYNQVYHNSVIGNTHPSQAGDYSTPGTNSWDNGATVGGNYWSDHTCVGDPSDGSQPYYIEGDAGAVDHYPFRDLNGWPTAPRVTTEPATNVTSSSATLNGYLNSPGVSSVEVSFEWATDAYYKSHGNTYGNETPAQIMTAPGPFAQNLSALSPDTTYHFRAKAVGDGIAYGADKTFGLCQIRGSVWNDTNGNGVWDGDESGTAGWTVYIDENENGQRDPGEIYTTTDASGGYHFDNLGPGTYVVAEEPQNGWQQTYPDAHPGTSISQTETEPPVKITTTGSTARGYLESYKAVSPAPNRADETIQSRPLIGIDDFRDNPRFASIDGRGYAVAILDTGIDLDHPFFGPDTDGNGIADRIVFQYDFGDNDNDASDSDGHGSNVASIAASEDATYTGIAPGANIIALKIADKQGEILWLYVENALQWLVNNAATYNVVAINMSLGDQKNYNTPVSPPQYGIGDELAKLTDKGIIVVSASGNHFYSLGSQQGVSYPSADPNSLSIGAVYDANIGYAAYVDGSIANSTGPDRICPFSQRDANLTTVFAPGAEMTGANQSGDIVRESGTSQASPHITGIAVLAQQLAENALGRCLTLAEFGSLLTSTGVTINDGDDEDDNVNNTNLDFKRVDMLGLAEGVLNMGAGHTHIVVLRPGEIEADVDFGNVNATTELSLILKGGWNMVSVPVIPDNNSVSAVFPGVAAVYIWNPVSKSYIVPATIEPGKGYWVAVTVDKNITITGVPVTTWDIDIKAGWNMMGSVIKSASIANPNDNPDGCVQPFVYGWDSVGMTYVMTTNIEPGKGYWVASVYDCVLCLP